MTDGLKDITPEGSVSPVFHDPTPMVPSDVPDFIALAAAQEAVRASAVAKLTALGLTEAEARAITG